MKIFLLAFAIVTTACSQKFAKASESQEVIKPGDVKFLEFEVNSKNPTIDCNGEKVKVYVEGKKGQAIIRESYFSPMKPFVCELKENGKVVHKFNFKVLDKEYKSEVLRVDMKRVRLNKKDQARANKEQEMLNKIWASSVDSFQFSGPFMAPLKSHITSVYGTRRLYNKNKKGQHLGTDFRAPIGEKIPAANRGRVVFSGDLFYTGGTVILDHGLDVFTVYGHLSKPIAKEGTIVERGDIIGLSGNSGRTSGPHLHWGVKIQNQYIDGFSLIEETERVFANKK